MAEGVDIVKRRMKMMDGKKVRVFFCDSMGVHCDRGGLCIRYTGGGVGNCCDGGGEIINYAGGASWQWVGVDVMEGVIGWNDTL